MNTININTSRYVSTFPDLHYYAGTYIISLHYNENDKKLGKHYYKYINFLYSINHHHITHSPILTPLNFPLGSFHYKTHAACF